jgi:hypothetical protein
MLVSSDEPKRAGYELEYSALRAEILKRVELRQQIMSLALTIAGVFLGLGITTGSIALVYPPLAVFLAIAWVQNDSRIFDMALFIRDKLEPAIPGLGWESFIQGKRQSDARQGKWRTTILSHGGTFLFTQAIAIGIGLIHFGFTTGEWILLAVDILSLILVIRALAQGRR